MDTPLRLAWVDILKILSIFAVITIHVSAPYLLTYNSMPISWWIGNTYDSLSRWCIPVFFMISGAFLLDHAYCKSLPSFLLHRLSRILIPLVVWSFLYFLWRKYFNNEQLLISDFLPMFFKEPLYYHLWFLYVIVQFYLIAPIIAVFVHNSRNSLLLYFVMLWILFSSILPMLEYFFRFNPYFATLDDKSLSGNIGYFILGYHLKSKSLRFPEYILCIIFFIAAFYLTLYGTYLLTITQATDNFNGFFYGYTTINVLVMALTILLIVKNTIPTSITKLSIISLSISKIASCVPGIYLIHAMVISALNNPRTQINLSETFSSPVLSIPVSTCIVFAVALILIFLIKRIPVIRFILP
jgi:surface polysaccharide O-acyltransferase-like enzyme